MQVANSSFFNIAFGQRQTLAKSFTLGSNASPHQAETFEKTSKRLERQLLVSKIHRLRNLLTVVIGGIETNQTEVSMQAIRCMLHELESCRSCPQAVRRIDQPFPQGVVSTVPEARMEIEES